MAPNVHQTNAPFAQSMKHDTTRQRRKDPESTNSHLSAAIHTKNHRNLLTPSSRLPHNRHVPRVRLPLAVAPVSITLRVRNIPTSAVRIRLLVVHNGNGPARTLARATVVTLPRGNRHLIASVSAPSPPSWQLTYLYVSSVLEGHDLSLGNDSEAVGMSSLLG
jgi:hypothetical protein